MTTIPGPVSEEVMVDEEVMVSDQQNPAGGEEQAMPEVDEEIGHEAEGPITTEIPTGSKIPIVSTFKDHFTLPIPSSVIRYRNLHSAARILEASDAQFVLEDLYDEREKSRHVSVRRIHDTSEGVRFLRTLYALVTAFWTGFLFIFCLQVLLFLFLDVAIQSGATSIQKANWGRALGTKKIQFVCSTLQN